MITFDFLTGVAIGVILFQSALIAPTVLKTLDAESTRIFLRSIWPKFFIVLILLRCCYFYVLISRFLQSFLFCYSLFFFFAGFPRHFVEFLSIAWNTTLWLTDRWDLRCILIPQRRKLF